MRCGRAAVLAGALLATQAVPALGQTPADPQEEARLLRAAASRESRGDLEGAEAILRGLLEQHPTSSGAVFALERVLRAQDRIREVLPPLDAYLELEPEASGPRYLKLRVLVELDSLQAVTAAAESWIRADPRSPDPYREAARAYERAFGPELALEVLLRGKEALGDSIALAVETGDLLLRMDHVPEAVREWSMAIGDDGTHTVQVLRRVGQLEGDRGALVKPLVDTLGQSPTTGARRRAAAQIAVEAGLEKEAVEHGRRAARELEGQALRGFLSDLARRGDESGGSSVSLWAYTELRKRARDGNETRALDERIVSAALASGDTALARKAQDRVASALPRGSPERRRALAASIRLAATREGAGKIRSRLRDFRAEFPGAPELDELAANLAWDLQARDRMDEAIAVLEGVAGPRSSLERAYLHFAQGNLEAGRAALFEAVPGLPVSSATDMIELAAVLDRVQQGTAELVAEAAALAHRGSDREAATRLARAAPSAPQADRPALLLLGARYADQGGDPDEAARLRARLITEYPDAPDVPEATVTLARYYAERPGGTEEAVRLLEELILSRPGSPVVPQARRELQRIRGRVPSEQSG